MKSYLSQQQKKNSMKIEAQKRFFFDWMLSIHIQIEAFVVQLKIAASLFSYVLQLSYTMLRVYALKQ